MSWQSVVGKQQLLLHACMRTCCAASAVHPTRVLTRAPFCTHTPSWHKQQQPMTVTHGQFCTPPPKAPQTNKRKGSVQGCQTLTRATLSSTGKQAAAHNALSTQRAVLFKSKPDRARGHAVWPPHKNNTSREGRSEGGQVDVTGDKPPRTHAIPFTVNRSRCAAAAAAQVQRMHRNNCAAHWRPRHAGGRNLTHEQQAGNTAWCVGPLLALRACRGSNRAVLRSTGRGRQVNSGWRKRQRHPSTLKQP